MRFSEDKIKEAILHPDLDVRDKAIRYFYGTTNLDYTLMPLAIRAIETYGRIQAFSFTHYLNLLPQTDQTIAWVVAELQRDFEGLPQDRYFYFLNLSRLLCQTDIRLVAQRAVEIHQAPLFDAKERLAFGERIAMFGWNAAQCWQELQRYCQENKAANNFEEFDLGHALRIVDTLAHQPHELQEQIVAVLAEQVQDFRHDARKWLQPLLANLAGEMRLQAAIPPLVGKLGHPYGFLANESMLALAKIGSEEVVSLVCEQYPRASRDFRIPLRLILETTAQAIAQSRHLPLADTVYQFKITLLECRPPIWRRIQIKDCTLDKLHEHIQTAMGWTNSHLSHFRIGDQLFGDSMLMEEGCEEMEYQDSTKTKISDVLPGDGKQFGFQYEYDFGDSWQHEILFEGILRAEAKVKYPLCLEGARACPPEDCGGVWGYNDFLEAVQNKDEEMLEWIGGRFDPEKFDPVKATKAMRRGLPDWRKMAWI